MAGRYHLSVAYTPYKSNICRPEYFERMLYCCSAQDVVVCAGLSCCLLADSDFPVVGCMCVYVCVLV